MSDQTGSTVIPMPCALLSKEIELLENEARHTTSRDQAKQLEQIVRALQEAHTHQCAGLKAEGPLAHRASAFLSGGNLVLTLVGANGVKVIFGGNDGILVTIDGAGHVHVAGPEGPGDPEIRSAVGAIMLGMSALSAPARAAAVG